MISIIEYARAVSYYSARVKHKIRVLDDEKVKVIIAYFDYSCTYTYIYLIAIQIKKKKQT